MIHVCTLPGCYAKFSRPYRLKLHLLKHAGEKPFQCDEDGCGKKYSNHSHLRRHKHKVHDGIKSETKKCPVENCSCIITSSNLRRHLRTVHDVHNKIKCLICNKSFRKKNQLKSHMFEHTGIKSFRCKNCPSTFETISEYKKHKRNHKSYTCSCGEIFYRWSIYLKHRKESEVHKAKFTCETCEKKFKDKRNYNIHLSTHSYEREVFECPMENCGRLYYYKRNLKQHVEIYHLKIKEYSIRKKQYPRKKKDNPSRKDKGTIKKSTALKLAGLVVPYEAEKNLLTGEQLEAENSEDFIDTSDFDFSDLEIRVQIFQNDNITSSEDESRNNRSILGKVN